MKKLNKYSRTVTQDNSQPAAQAMLYAIGFTDDDFNKPLIGIASTGYEGNPCNMHLNNLALDVKDGVNSIDFKRSKRTPNPKRLLRAYHQSAATLNLLRAFTSGGLADLSKIKEWNETFIENSMKSNISALSTGYGTVKNGYPIFQK